MIIATETVMLKCQSRPF